MKQHIGRFLAFVPALLVMIMIFMFSMEDSSESTDTSMGFTTRLIRIVDSELKLNLTESEILQKSEEIEHFIRKTAHFSEYMLLALTIGFPLYFIFHLTKYKYFFIIESICALYAVSDEFHQYFVPGRSASLIDVIIDSSGAFLGILLSKLAISIINKIKNSTANNINC